MAEPTDRDSDLAYRRVVRDNIDDAVSSLDEAVELLVETGLPDSDRAQLASIIGDARQAVVHARDAVVNHIRKAADTAADPADERMPEIADQRAELRAKVAGGLLGRLAERLAHHAFCDEHTECAASPECPFCTDRAVYRAYLESGGHDYRPDTSGPGVSVFALRTGRFPRADRGEGR